MKKVAVVLSGSGHKDGSEITEAVSAIVTLSKEGAQYTCFAPNIKITATNHLTGEAQSERNIMEETARITRGQVKDLAVLNESEFDALLFPGGYGAALHLCDWAKKGAACTVNPEVTKAINSFYDAGKPIGAICIAPVLVAKVLGRKGVTVTLGMGGEASQEVLKTGAQHENCPVNDYVSDRDHKILTTPAYMCDAQPHEVFTGISKMVKELVEMA